MNRIKQDINTNNIKEHLLPFGITFDAFKAMTGGLAGNVVVPSALRAFNKELKVEDAFYFVANKVFWTANELCYQIPNKLRPEFRNTIGDENYELWQYAIFEEINHRFISNSFPEFERAGQMNLSNTNIQFGYSGGQTLNQWFNAQSRTMLMNINFRQFDDEAEVIRDRVFMYRDLKNIDMPLTNKYWMMQITPTGEFSKQPVDEFAKTDEFVVDKQNLAELVKKYTHSVSEINDIKETISHFATKRDVENRLFAFAQMDEYDSSRIYKKGDYCRNMSKIYISIDNDNINHVPGGIDTNKWWYEIHTYDYETKTNLLYAPGANIQNVRINPNVTHYVAIDDLLQIDDFSIENIFNWLDEKFKWLNLSIDDVDLFIKNICDYDKNILIDYYAPEIKYSNGHIELFSTIAALDEFIESNKLVEYSDETGIGDFKRLPYGYYIRVGEESNRIGGSGLISQSDLPNVTYGYDSVIKAGYSFGSLSGLQTWFSNYKNVNIWESTEYITWTCGITVERQQSSLCYKYALLIYLNGNVTQTKFQPPYLNIHGIEFIKPIYKKKLRFFANIMPITFESIKDQQ